MTARRPYRWERSYPPGVHWDAPITTTTLGALLDRAALYGARPALDHRGRVIAYEELARSADALGAALLARGVGPGAAVALYLPNVPTHPVAFFAAAKAGARIVQLSPLDAERALAFKLRDSGARTLVTIAAPGLVAMARKLRASGVVDRVLVDGEEPLSEPGEGIERLADLVAEGAALSPRWPAVAAGDVALIQYTGGTTGTPKGVMLSHANLTGAVAMYEEWTRGQGLLQAGAERVICVLPLFHIYGLTVVLLRHLKQGNLILLHERFRAEAVLDDIEHKRATLLNGVPTMWIALAAHPGIARRDLSSLRQITSGAAPLPVEVERQIERLTGHRLGGGWGMTETAPAGTNLPYEAVRPGSVGLPLPGIVLEVVALDDPRRVLGPGETGELRIMGANVTAGYWNRAAETAAAFVDGFLLTGDLGRMDADGYVYLAGRKKEMIISGGFNVYPLQVEEAIYEHPAVAETIVIGIPDRYRGETAKAFVTLKPGAAPFTLEALRTFLADKLGRHELPGALEFRDALPRTAVGKLSRKDLSDEELGKDAAAPVAEEG
jgi:long-chain acyl-CoA synthetase